MAGGGLEAIASAAMEQFVGQGQQVMKAFYSITNLTDLYYAYKALPFRWVLAVHSLFVSTLADDFKGHFLMHFWVSSMMKNASNFVNLRRALAINPRYGRLAIN